MMLGFNGGRIGKTNTVFTGTVSDDPNYSSVSLLLNGNDLTDSSGYNHTLSNFDIIVDTTTKKYGSGSLKFSTSAYGTFPHDTSFDIGTGDFTIEAWVYPQNTGTRGIAHNRPSFTGGGFTFWVSTNSQLVIQLFTNGSSSGDSLTSTTTVPNGTWAHVAYSRSGGTGYLFVNGNLEGTNTDSRNLTNNSAFYIGVAEGSNYRGIGYIDDLRFTVGVARYTNSFTPPTAQLPGGGTGTIASGVWTPREQCDAVRREIWPGFVPLSIVTDGLVVHLDAGDSASYPGSGTTWTDLSGNGNNATLFGTPSYTESPGYFDITSDSTYVRLSSYSHLTNDFTYSMWVRFDAFDSYDTLISNGSYPDVGPLFRVESTTSIAVYTETTLRGTFTWSPSTNTWYNVVYTRSGSTNTFYVNGTQSGSTFTDQTNISLSNAYTFLMRSQHAAGEFTNGQLAQYAMYSKALTPSEITQNFNALKGRYGL